MLFCTILIVGIASVPTLPLNPCMMNSFFLKVDGRNKKFLFNEILYAEAYKNYVRIHTAKKTFCAHYSLKQIEENLPSGQFCRIHKSYIVSFDRITEFDCDTVYIDAIELPLSAQFAGILRSKLNIIVSEKKNKSSFRLKRSFSKN